MLLVEAQMKFVQYLYLRIAGVHGQLDCVLGCQDDRRPHGNGMKHPGPGYATLIRNMNHLSRLATGHMNSFAGEVYRTRLQH